MTEPRRLLDDAGLGDAEKRALQAGRSHRADSQQRAAIWAAMMPVLPVDPGIAAGTSTGAATGAAATGATATGATATGATATGAAGVAAGAGWLGAMKAGLVGAGVMGALLGAQTLLAPPPPTAPAVTTATASVVAAPTAPPSVKEAVAAPPVVAPAPVPVPVAVVATATVAATVPAPEPAPVPAASSAPAPAASSAPPVEGPSEGELVVRARQALRSGDAAGALRHLREASEKFPRGTLGQEREVLTLEALARQGQPVRARAEAFLRANPSSPFAERLRALIGGP